MRISIFIILFLIMGIFPGIMLLHSMYRDNERDREIYYVSQSEFIGYNQKEIDLLFKGIFSDLEYLSSSPIFKNYLINGSGKKMLQENWFLFLKTYRSYDQIRYLDKNGQEQIRINFNDGNPVIIPEKELQNKKDRYYFSMLEDFTSPTILISPLDLNMENQKVEYPYKPMIRFSLPFFNNEGDFQGALVLNYFASNFLTHLENEIHSKTSSMYLLNSDGYILAGPEENDLWGFMFEGKKDRTFLNLFGNELADHLAEEENIFYGRAGLFVTTTINGSNDYFSDNKQSSLAGYNTFYMDSWWKIVSVGRKGENILFQKSLLVSLLGSLWKLEIFFLMFTLGLSYLISTLFVRKIIAEEMSETYRNVMHEVVNALEITTSLEDDDTGNHIQRVCLYTSILAKEYGLAKDDAELISELASLHDIGKVGIHDSILKKKGPLTNEEREEMKNHVIIGHEVTEKLKIDPVAENIVLYHHENWDKSGYSHNLDGHSIPLEARIVSLADVYDALRSVRSYKPAFSHSKSREIILSESGKKFDPDVVDAFQRSEFKFIQVSNDYTDIR